MKTYNVTPELVGFSRKRKLLDVLIGAVLFVLLEVLFQWRSFFSNSPHRLSPIMVNAAISGVIYAGVDAVFIERRFTYEIVVTDDCIAAIGPGVKRSVRKNELKTISESEGNFFVGPGLRISKHGPFGTWFWGSIWIPKTLPEYESVRALVLSWQSRPLI